MFGYVKPLIPELKVKQHKLYQSVYCTLCKRQKKLTGTMSSFALSYDFVFLALMRSAVTGEDFHLKPSHCAYNVFKKKDCIADSLAIDYTGCAATLLTYYKLKDNIDDGNVFQKIKYSLGCAAVLPCKKRAVNKFSLPEKEIKELLGELSRAEKREICSLDECADIFGRLLGIVAEYGVEDQLQAFVLNKCFYLIGKWIYIIDAVDDYPDDIKNQTFNPFIKGNVYNSQSVDFALQAILNELDSYVLKIKFMDEDISDIIKNIVYLGSDSVAKSVFINTEKKLSEMKGTDK